MKTVVVLIGGFVLGVLATAAGGWLYIHHAMGTIAASSNRQSAS